MIMIAIAGVIGRGAEVVGRVVDAHGARVVGAQVTLRPEAKPSAEQQGRTDDSGEYRFRGVPAGEARLDVVQMGFSRLSLRFAGLPISNP